MIYHVYNRFARGAEIFREFCQTEPQPAIDEVRVEEFDCSSDCPGVPTLEHDSLRARQGGSPGSVTLSWSGTGPGSYNLHRVEEVRQDIDCRRHLRLRACSHHLLLETLPCASISLSPA